MHAAGFEYFVHLLSRSLMFSHLLVSQLSVVATSLCMLLIHFQTAQNIALSQVDASCLSPVLIFLFPKSQLIPSCRKHCVFTSRCNLCVSRPISSYSLIHNFFQTAKIILFLQLNAACVSCPIFPISPFPNSRLINSFDVALPMDYVICDVLLLFKRKARPFFKSFLMLLKLQNPLAGPRQTNWS